ncbi:beta-fructofuranosidase [Mesocricetibacter intestinalis]|uniref:Sucrose-6-phosphate hydrolase n=1 Tax=Mesocricetibacter intestinalis TaxID=1521930 RepID=A0A4R6VGV7_9PAST|nr:glycoside hydrolase family 32 protein [Mesocricetibacter intestinalis]TDQ57205.1 beta-fructofuranosidase [Mesocricetibacter intestinalis]
MMIFNNGKYKSILAAQAGELENIRRRVEEDKDFRPCYHLAPPTGLLNDPNGLIFDGEKYHIFYQWFPFDALHGMKHWKHFTTSDWLCYKEAQPLIPTEAFESHGCYSGGALMVEDKIALFYTGNTRRAEDNQRIPYQNLAIFDKAGNLLEKRSLLENAPPGYTEHVRDPKPFFSATGKIRFICGAQRQDLSGTAILFEMDDLEDSPRLLGELELPDFDNRHVFMWECPDLLKIDQQDLFIWSPQGKPREKLQYQNNYHALYALGHLSQGRFNAESVAELDQGFDFYAPQTFGGLPNNEYALLYAWCGLPDLSYPTDSYRWHSMLCMPREIRVHKGELYQQPLAQIYQNIKMAQPVTVEKEIELKDLDRSYLKFDAQNTPFNICFFANRKGQRLTLSYDGKTLCLDRSHSEQTETMLKFGEQRYCALDSLHQVEIFFDRSILEIFLNGGEKAMTSRFFIADRQNRLSCDRPLLLEIGYPQAISYK